MAGQKTKNIDNQTEQVLEKTIENNPDNIEIGVTNPEGQDKHIAKSVDEVIDGILAFVDKYSEIAKAHGNSSEYANYISFKSQLRKVLLSYKNE